MNENADDSLFSNANTMHPFRHISEKTLTSLMFPPEQCHLKFSRYKTKPVTVKVRSWGPLQEGKLLPNAMKMTEVGKLYCDLA